MTIKEHYGMMMQCGNMEANMFSRVTCVTRGLVDGMKVGPVG